MASKDEEHERAAAERATELFREQLPEWLTVVECNGPRVRLVFTDAPTQWSVCLRFHYKKGDFLGFATVSVNNEDAWNAEEVRFQANSFAALLRKLRERFPSLCSWHSSSERDETLMAGS